MHDQGLKGRVKFNVILYEIQLYSVQQKVNGQLKRQMRIYWEGAKIENSDPAFQPTTLIKATAVDLCSFLTC